MGLVVRSLILSVLTSILLAPSHWHPPDTAADRGCDRCTGRLRTGDRHRHVLGTSFRSAVDMGICATCGTAAHIADRTTLIHAGIHSWGRALAWRLPQSRLRPGWRASPDLVPTIQIMNTQPVAIVTAASQGIGAACARRLSRDGFRLALMSRSESIHDVAKEVDGLGLQGDLTDPIDINHLVGKTLEHYGRLDSVVINTGHLPKGPLLELTDDNWQEGMNMVLMSVARITRAAVPAMRAWGPGGPSPASQAQHHEKSWTSFRFRP